MDFYNLFIINKLTSKNGSENSVCKWLSILPRPAAFLPGGGAGAG